MALSSPRGASRHEKAKATRRRIAEAAGRLFVDQGYTHTTIADIAHAAGVAPQTVYFVYGTKANVLAAVMDIEIVGDAEPIPLLERPPLKRIAGINDPSRRLERIVTLACNVTEQLAPLYELVRAGGVEHEVAELLDRHEDQRWRTLRTLVELIEADLTDGVDGDHAADHLYAILSHDVYWLLVRRRAWTSTQWRRWAAGNSAARLLSHGRRPTRNRNS
jgi:AcrR family transcriptional regulator